MSTQTGDPESPDGLEDLFEDVMLQGSVEDELVVQYAEDPDQLAPADRERVEAALREDPELADQLRILQTFDASMAGGGEQTGSGGGAVVSITDHPRWRAPLVFAAIAAAVIAAFVYGTTGGLGDGTESGSQVAVQDPAQEDPTLPTPSDSTGRPDETTGPSGPLQERSEEQLAHEGSSSPGPEPTPDAPSPLPIPEPVQPEPQIAVLPSPSPRGGERESAPIPTPPIEPKRIVEENEAAREPILLAMNVTGPMQYRPPAGAIELPMIGGLRRGGAESAGAQAAEKTSLVALAPRHTGRTTHSSPTLYWYLSGDTGLEGQFTLIDEVSDDPLLEFKLEAPIAAGIHEIDLGAFEVELESGNRYRWFVSLVEDDSEEPVSLASGGIERVAPSPEMQAEIAAAPVGDRGRLYAAAGYWYDALGFISELVVEQPDEPRLRVLRAELLEGAGLGEVVEGDR